MARPKALQDSGPAETPARSPFVHPLVGREKEIARLRELHAERKHVLILGPAGVGKSALVEQVREKLSLFVSPKSVHFGEICDSLEPELRLRGEGLRLLQRKRQLAAQANLKLRAHPVSVLGQRCGLCDKWLEKELMPVIESHREQAVAALKRKTGALREAVIRMLQARLGKDVEPGRLASPLRYQEAIKALRKADASLETAQRNSELILDGLSSLSHEILDAVATGMAAGGTDLEGDLQTLQNW